MAETEPIVAVHRHECEITLDSRGEGISWEHAVHVALAGEPPGSFVENTPSLPDGMKATRFIFSIGRRVLDVPALRSAGPHDDSCEGVARIDRTCRCAMRFMRHAQVINAS